jgi:hypothetical protein
LNAFSIARDLIVLYSKGWQRLNPYATLTDPDALTAIGCSGKLALANHSSDILAADKLYASAIGLNAITA